ncbi:MAG: squalene/phytoene synthase family protein [candidate division Zixibacteria bacterium]|nr:squalene/phytoene synthase family protein [Candidatus Tariuqbacter arcticus]
MNAELKWGYEYCRDLARRKAGNFYYSFIFLPKTKRRAIHALYAFCHRGDQIADEFQEGNINGALRDFSELRKNFRGCLDGKPHSSPLFTALGDSIRRFQLSEKHFYQLMEGMESDLNFSPFDTFEDLREYCYKVASTVGLLCVEIFGCRDDSVKVYAENLGVALQLTNIIRDIKEDYQRGRVYLPQEDLERFKYSETDLKREWTGENFQRLMEFQYQRALEFYQTADKSLPASERKSQIASEIMKSIYRKLLEIIRRRQFQVFNRRISLSGFMKAAIALATYFDIKFSGSKK